jgi:MacB-like periplasmic core domain
VNYATPDYFRVLRVPLIAGRVFAASDTANSEPIAVINQAFADRYLKGQQAIGQILRLGSKPVQVIGVVGNIQTERAGWGDFGPLAHVPTVLIPTAQLDDQQMRLDHVFGSPSFVIRTSLPQRDAVAALQDALASADPLLPIGEIHSITELKRASLDEQHLMAGLVDSLGLLAILLTALGVYGLIANMVTERTKELGIRLALGSSTALAIRTVLRPGIVWVIAGGIAGAIASLALGRLLHSFIFGIGSADPMTLAGVAAGVLVVTSIAAGIPAVRITRLNPADTLRAE